MKKYIIPYILFYLFTLLLCSCAKTPDPLPGGNGIPMTLTVDLGTGTKVAYTPDVESVKSSWEADETISVVTLSSATDGAIVAVDNFTSSGTAGRSRAEFTGTYTGGTEPAKVIVIYPALTKNGDKYELPPYTDGDGNPQILLSGAAVGNAYFYASSNKALKQTANNDCSHLNNYCVATGIVNTEKIATNELSATLKNIPVVFKMGIFIEPVFAGVNIQKIVIESYNDKGKPSEMFNSASWEYADIEAHGISTPGTVKVSNTTLKCGFAVPADGFVTAFFPVTGMKDCTENYFWRVKTYLENGTTLQSDMGFFHNVAVQRGTVYTIDVSYVGITE